jgi:uncharacterized protein (DUF1330 family)
MSAFFIFDNIETLDEAAINEYIAKAPPTVAAYGGVYRSIYGRTLVVEGDYKPNLPIIIEFPSFDRANAWYESEMYRALKVLRIGAQISTGYLVDGLPKMPWYVRLLTKFGIGRNR